MGNLDRTSKTLVLYRGSVNEVGPPPVRTGGVQLHILTPGKFLSIDIMIMLIQEPSGRQISFRIQFSAAFSIESKPYLYFTPLNKILSFLSASELKAYLSYLLLSQIVSFLAPIESNLMFLIPQ